MKEKRFSKEQQVHFKELELGQDIESGLYIDSRERYDYLNQVYETKKNAYKKNKHKTF